jgi:iron complex transport system substrate-binding protein
MLYAGVLDMKSNPYQRKPFTSLFVVLIILGSLFVLGPATVFASGANETDNDSIKTRELELQEGYPLVVIDDLGNEVELDNKPQRIASLTLFTDEVLFDLVEPDRISVVTFLATDDVYSNVANAARVIPKQLDLNVEQLLAINPDIVFVANWSDGEKVRQLRNAGIPVFAISTPFTIESIYDSIRSVAEVVGEVEAGEEIISIMEEKIQFVSDALVNLPESDRLGALEYNSWGTSAGIDTTWHEVLRLAGIKNLASDLVADGFGMVPMSKELIIELDPDVLFLPGFIYGDPEGAKNFMENVSNDPALANVSAKVNDRLITIPEHLKSSYSQYFADTVLFVAQLIYPEYFN